MLDILIERFEEHFSTDEDNTVIDRCLDEGFQALTDETYLIENVIGQGRFEWDFSANGDGFIALVAPFMAKDSGSSHLFLHALRALDLDQPEYEKAILILEYSYHALLINDYFNFHKAFTPSTVDMRASSKLTQLRYAGQYLNTYPRHLLVNNALGVDDETLVSLHRWLSNVYIALGMSRGLLVKWSHVLFAEVRMEHYLQNSINALCNYILYPVVLAAILAKTPDKKMYDLKAAFSYLTLFTKLRCERRIRLGLLAPEPDPYHEQGLIPITLQGYAFIKKGLKLDPLRYSGLRYPDIADLHASIARLVGNETDEALLRDMEEQEQDCFSRFRVELRKTGLLADMADLFARAFGIDAETPR